MAQERSEYDFDFQKLIGCRVINTKKHQNTGAINLNFDSDLTMIIADKANKFTEEELRLFEGRVVMDVTVDDDGVWLDFGNDNVILAGDRDGIMTPFKFYEIRRLSVENEENKESLMRVDPFASPPVCDCGGGISCCLDVRG